MTSRPTYQVIPGKEKIPGQAEEACQECRRNLSGARPGPRGRSHCLRTWPPNSVAAAASSKRVRPARGARQLQRNHQAGRPGGVPASARHRRRTWWMHSRPGACSTASWATRFLRCYGTRSAAAFPPDACRPLPAAHRRARTRDQGLHPIEYWTLDAHLQRPKPPAFDARLVGTKREKNGSPQRRGGEAAGIGAAACRLDGAFGGDARNAGTTRVRHSPPANSSRTRRANWA